MNSAFSFIVHVGLSYMAWHGDIIPLVAGTEKGKERTKRKRKSIPSVKNKRRRKRKKKKKKRKRRRGQKAGAQTLLHMFLFMTSSPLFMYSILCGIVCGLLFILCSVCEMAAKTYVTALSIILDLYILTPPILLSGHIYHGMATFFLPPYTTCSHHLSAGLFLTYPCPSANTITLPTLTTAAPATGKGEGEERKNRMAAFSSSFSCLNIPLMSPCLNILFCHCIKHYYCSGAACSVYLYSCFPLFYFAYYDICWYMSLCLL